MKVIELMRALSEMDPRSEVFVVVNEEARAHELLFTEETKVGLVRDNAGLACLDFGPEEEHAQTVCMIAVTNDL